MKRTRSMTSHGQSVRPGMKRDHTVIIIDDDNRTSESSAKKARVPQRTATKDKLDKTDTAPLKPNLQRKATSVVNDGIVTSAVALESGSHFGRMSSLDAPTLAKHMKVTQVPKSILKKAPSTAAAAVSHLRYIAPHLTQPYVVSQPGYPFTSLGMATPHVAGPSQNAHRMSNIIPLTPQFQPPTVEIVFSFDTTGSMYESLVAIRSHLRIMALELQKEMPGIRIGIIAHGDYFDADKYILKWINFGASLSELHEFITNVEQTHGGDGDECYELVLKTVQNVFSWSAHTSKVLVMIGDAAPHEPGYLPGYDINWREECQKLAKMGVRIFSFQAGVWDIPFYRIISNMTGGLHLRLKDYHTLRESLLLVCHSAAGEAQLRRFQERNKEFVKNAALFNQRLLMATAKATAPVQTPPPLTKKKTVQIRVPGIAPPQQVRGVIDQSLRRVIDPSSPPRLTRTRSGRLIIQNQLRGTAENVPTKPALPPLRYALTRTKSGKYTYQKPVKPVVKAPLHKLKLTRTRSGRLTVAPSSSQMIPTGKDDKSSSGNVLTPKAKGKRVNLIKNKRENVSSTDFMTLVPNVLTNVSEWKVMIKPEDKKSAKSLKWKKEAWSGGQCDRNVFNQRDLGLPTFYEIAVKVGKKLYVVYWKVVKSIPKGSTVYTYLLGNKEIRSKVKENIQKGNTIHIKRYQIIGHEAPLKTALFGNFDYAWVNRGKQVCRDVEGDGQSF